MGYAAEVFNLNTRTRMRHPPSIGVLILTLSVAVLLVHNKRVATVEPVFTNLKTRARTLHLARQTQSQCAVEDVHFGPEYRKGRELRNDLKSQHSVKYQKPDAINLSGRDISNRLATFAYMKLRLPK